MRDMATGKVPIFLPAIRNSLVVFCLAPKLNDNKNETKKLERFYGSQIY